MTTTDYMQHPAPSTFDAPLLPIMGAQDDPVLETLKAARARYERFATAGSYVDWDHGTSRRTVRGVCAVGALIVSDRRSRDAFFRPYVDSVDVIETYARESTREALALLNKSAKRLYRRGYTVASDASLGRVETINEDECIPFEERKAMVLRCYDHAIAQRSGEQS